MIYEEIIIEARIKHKKNKDGRPKGAGGFFCTKGFFLQKIWEPKLSNGESVKYAFLSNFPIVKNLCEKEFSGVWLTKPSVT